MMVINAGLGRTGTHSLKTAFETLEYSPCYSAERMWESPGHAEIWAEACDGQPVDWTALLATYKSGVDWPVCSFWREIIGHFPSVKVLLSTREPDAWYSSFQATVYAALTTPLKTADSTSTEVIPVFQRLPSIGARVISHRFTDDLGSRESMIAAYHKHNEDVRAAVPSERLLEWSVGQGWGPLCEFLDIPKPVHPFPNVNDRKSYRGLLNLQD